MKVTYIKLAKIKKLDEEVKYIVPTNRNGERTKINGKTLKKVGAYAGQENGMVYATINEQLIDKINELVDAVNKLRRSSNEYYRKD